MKNVMMVLAGSLILLSFENLSHAQNSVLSESNWYKISVHETGVHQITYNDLLGWGIDPAQINPQQIRLFGNGNGMLPESNDVFRYDDLQENAIFVMGEDDGNFDPGDYILFYGEGPTEWNLNTETGLFEHETNLYSDITCYFLNVDLGEGKRIETQYSTLIPTTYFATSFNDYYGHELELENLIHSGKSWYGECFDEVLSYNFQVEFPNISSADTLVFTAQAAGRSAIVSTLEFFINMTIDFQLDFPAVNFSNINSEFAKIRNDSKHFITNSETLNIDIGYQKPDEYSKAWLDYFEINARRDLIYTQGQMTFRDVGSVFPGSVTTFTIEATNANAMIWNVTDPLNVSSVDFTSNGQTIEFILETDSLLEFILFDGSEYLSPTFIGEIENQNLHDLEAVDFLIVTHEDFIAEAQQLASFRQSFNGISTFVTTPEKIYNEFSSGVQDVTAIRDFIKYLYEKSNGEKPENLLLFGDASYDYKNRISNNTNYIPLWESFESLNNVMSYSTDDFFSEFDEVDKTSLLKIGVGRLPVKNSNEANAVVQKIIHYSSGEAMGNWRNEIMMIADDEDGNLHFEQADEISRLIDTIRPSFNISKIYLDAFVQDSFLNGNPAYSLVNQAITDKINSGVNMISYTGHGFYGGLAHEKILTELDLDNWINTDYYPLLFTASCDFGWFDDPDKYSLTEKAILLEGKGMSAIIAATRPTYAGSNKTFHENFMKVMLNNPEYSIGKSLKQAKLLTGWSNNIRKYCLFGDPSMRLAIPLNNVVTLAINGLIAEEFNDTIHPAEQVVVSGFVTDINNEPLYSFSGNLKVKVFDIIRIDSTLGNDYSSTVAAFQIQDSVIYELETEVINGQFAFSFYYPNVSYEEFGNIKLSYYAHDNLEDASGYFTGIMVGGQASSTSEHKKEMGLIRFYPTMVTDVLNFSVSEDIGNLQIGIFNLQGNQVLHLPYRVCPKGYIGTINVSDLLPGMYILKAKTDRGVQSVKIIKR